jgi:hypothetical protein
MPSLKRRDASEITSRAAGHGIEWHEVIAQAFESAALRKALRQFNVVEHILQRCSIFFRKHRPHRAPQARADAA